MDSDDDDFPGSFEMDESNDMDDSSCHGGIIPSFESLKPEEIVKMMNESIEHVNSVVKVICMPMHYALYSIISNLQQQTLIIR